MSLFRRLGREVERFRQLALAAAEETADGRSTVPCPECGAVLPTHYMRCLECGCRSPYAILDISPGATEAEVRAAAREEIKAAHPDQGGTTEEFRTVKRARDRLLDSD